MKVPRFLVVAVVAVAAVAGSLVALRQMNTVLASDHRFNAIAEEAQTNAGSYSFIETSDPSVPVSWSYNRVASTSGSKYVEVGWIKDDAYAQDPSPFWIYFNGSTGEGRRIGTTTLTTGTSYNYQVKYTAGTNWAIYFNELNVPDKTVNIGASSTDTVLVGAEVTSTSDNIGDSTDTNTTYRSTSNGNFYSACNMKEWNQSEPNFSIDNLPGCGNWRFYDAQN